MLEADATKIKKEDLTENWHKAAWSFGAEARASQRSRYPNKDDRGDMAYYTKYKEWDKAPKEGQALLRSIFYAGWDAEDKYHFI